MHPVICQFGPFTLRSFGLMAALGFLAAYLVVRRFSERIAGIPRDDSSQLLVFAMVGGALGARLAYVAEHWSAEFAGQSLLEILRFDRGGLMFYGGLGGAIVAIAVLSRLRNCRIVDLLDLSAVALPLGHAFGRIGCFLNGCCYGRPAESLLSVQYPAGSEPWHAQVAAGLIPRTALNSLPVIPSQIVEAVLDVALFALLARMASRGPRRMSLSGLYLVSYAIIRFGTETLRSDPRMSVGPLSISQFICIFTFAAGCVLLAASRLDKSARRAMP